MEIKVFNNNVEKALKIAKKKLAGEGLFRELKRRRFYEKPSLKKKNKEREAQRRRQKWLAKLESFRDLKDGWNSYTAPAPNETALRTACMFVTELRAQGREPGAAARAAGDARGCAGMSRSLELLRSPPGIHFKF